MIYYTIVLVSEIFGYVPKCFKALVKQGYKNNKKLQADESSLDLFVNPLMAKKNALKENEGTGENNAAAEELEMFTDELNSKLDEDKKKLNDNDDDEIEFANNPLMAANTKDNSLPPELMPPPGNFLPPSPLPE